MGSSHAPVDVRPILQRAGRDGIAFLLRHGPHVGKATLREEREDLITFEGETRDLEALELSKGASLQLEFEERGRRYQAVGTIQTLTFGEGGGLLTLTPPRALACLNPEAYLDHVPERPPRGTYTTVGHDLLDGKVVGFSEAGLEIAWVKGRKEDFRLGIPLALSVDLGAQGRPELQGTPAYFTGETVGLKVGAGADPAHLERYQAWVRARLHEDRERDRLDFSRDGFQIQRDALSSRKLHTRGLMLLSERDPLVLVMAEDMQLGLHLGASLGRKFGFGYLDYLAGELRPQLVREGSADPWGGFRLILVHHRLKVASGYELIRQVVQKEQCPHPVLLVGSVEDLDLKRNRAIAAGAVDFLAVEPFHVLKIMKAIEATLAMFG